MSIGHSSVGRDWSELGRSDSGRVHLVADFQSDLIELEENAKGVGLTFLVLEVDVGASEKAVLASFARGLRFPAYFGGNWDALEECLSDLSWLGPSRGWVVLLRRAERLLDSDADALHVLTDVARSVAEHWARARPRRRFDLFLAVDPKYPIGSLDLRGPICHHGS